MNSLDESSASGPSTRRWLATGAALASTTLWLASCGPADHERVALAPVNGSVLHDGKPAAGVELRFHPAPPRADGLTPVARTREDGTFAVTTYEDEDGAPPGRYSIGLRWPVTDPAVLSGPKPDRLHEKYRDPAKSTWTVTIAAGGTALESIQIPSASDVESRRRQATNVRSKPSKSHDGPRSRGQSKGGNP